MFFRRATSSFLATYEILTSNCPSTENLTERSFALSFCLNTDQEAQQNRCFVPS